MPVFELAVITVLVLINGFLAMSEIAIVSARRSRLRQLADGGDLGAGQALALLADSSRFLATVQIGITLVGILAGAYSGATLAEPLAGRLAAVPALAPFAPSLALALVVLPVTYLSLVVGELVPKRLALAHAEAIAARVAPVMVVMARLGGTVVWLLGRSIDLVLLVLRHRPPPASSVTEEEVKALVAEAAETGVLHAAEQAMIEGVLRIADRATVSVMTPREQVVALSPDDAPEVVQRLVAASGHSRYPVEAEDGSILGVAHAKDLLDRLMRREPFALRACLRPALVVKESLPVLQLLERFRSSSVHLAVVIDPEGRLVGVATPLDVLAGIVGELPPELRGEADMVVRRPDGTLLVDGALPLGELETLLGIDL
jgi:putative hemolysin